MGLKSKVKKSVKKVSKVATAAKPANLKKVGNKVFNSVKEAAAPVVAAAAPVVAGIATGGLSAVVPVATAMLANYSQQYAPLQEDYFPAQEDYFPAQEDYSPNYASGVSLSAELSPPEREAFYRQAYNNALKSVPSVEEGGGFLSVLLRILFG